MSLMWSETVCRDKDVRRCSLYTKSLFIELNLKH